MGGILYIVSTPIGNYEDITLRALKTLKDTDEVICEEFREGKRVLRQYGIDKPVRRLNEHNEKKETPHIIEELKDGKNFALISDCGTPIFADPGSYLIKEAVSANIKLVPVPGASSLMSALAVAGIPIDRFIYYGFLSPKREIRRKELLRIKGSFFKQPPYPPLLMGRGEKMPVVLLDTPYRLFSLLEDIADVMGKGVHIILCMDITCPSEEILRGSAEEILTRLKKGGGKREFVLIINNRTDIL